MNEPTKRAMTAKASRKVLKKPRPSLTSCLVLGGDLGAGEHLGAVGHDRPRCGRPARRLDDAVLGDDLDGVDLAGLGQVRPGPPRR